MIYRFNAADLVELWQHAKQAKKHSPFYGEQATGPALMLVKDHGVYFMSNGMPGLMLGDPANPLRHKCVYAHGHNPQTDPDFWVGGDDFGEAIDDPNFWDSVLDPAKPYKYIEVEIDGSGIKLSATD